MEVLKCGVVAFVLAMLLSSPAFSQTPQEEVAPVGTATGTIERIETDVNGLYSIWFKVDGRMHEFRIRGAKLQNGSELDFAEGKRVEVKFKDRTHSEMDDFYTSIATLVVLLKPAQ